MSHVTFRLCARILRQHAYEKLRRRRQDNHVVHGTEQRDRIRHDVNRTHEIEQREGEQELHRARCITPQHRKEQHSNITPQCTQ